MASLKSPTIVFTPCMTYQGSSCLHITYPDHPWTTFSERINRTLRRTERTKLLETPSPPLSTAKMKGRNWPAGLDSNKGRITCIM